MGTSTPNLGLYKPSVGENGWGTLVNSSIDTIDGAIAARVDPSAAAWGLLAVSMFGPPGSSASQPGAATIYLQKMMVPASISVTSIGLDLTTAGTNYTNAQLGLYLSTGVFVGATAVYASAGTNNFGVTGWNDRALVGGPFAVTGGPGVFVWAAIHAGTNAATAFAVRGDGTGNPTILNAGLSAAAAKAGSYTGHATNDLATIGNLTPASITNNGLQFRLGLK